MDGKGKGKEVLGLNSGVFNSSVFNNASFGSFSNLQDFPFFESLTSLGDLSALGAAFHQSVPSLPEHLAAAAAAHAAATAAAGQQGSATNLGSFNLGRNDSFANFTQSSLQNLQLFLSEVEQGVIASGQVQQPQPSPPLQQQQPQHAHQSQQAQPLPPAAAATYAPIKTTTTASQPHHHPSLQPLKAGPAPTPIAPAPIYPSPAQFAAFAPSMHTYPHPQQPQHSTQQWGPRPGAQMLSPKLPLAPSSAAMMAQPGVGGATSLAPIGGPPAGGLAVPQEFSSTLYSLASTLPPPMILSNDSVLGSVGGGLHFQRHCVRRRMPDELTQADPSMFLN